MTYLVGTLDKCAFLAAHLSELEKVARVTLFDDTPASDADVAARVRDVEILVVNTFPVTEQILARAGKLKLLCVFGAGVDHVDVAAAGRRRIAVCNAPGYATEATAEHVIGLMLNAARSASRAERDLRQGIWNPHRYVGFELAGKSLGLIGHGKIGKRVGEIAAAGFGMRIRYVDSASSRERLEDLLRHSDIISIHAPLTQATRGLLSSREFALMKDRVVIINAGRGAIIDESALIANLRSGKVFAAGLDCFAEEPLALDNPLLSFDNVVMTPHMGFKTEASAHRASRMVTDNILSFIAGKPVNLV